MRRDLLTRAAVVLMAALSVALGAPGWLRCILVGGAAVAVAHALVRHRERGAVDATLVAAGGLLVTPVVTGLVLDLVGLRLTPTAWAFSLAGVALLGLLVSTRAAADGLGLASTRPRLPWREATWFVAAGCVVAFAIAVSVRSVNRLDVAPVAMSVGVEGGNGVQVVLSSDESAGPFELRTDVGGGNSVSYPLVSLRAGQPVSTTVYLPRKGRYVITLNNPGQDAPVRSLTVDR